MEKMLTNVDFRCTDEFKRLVTELADGLGMDRSEFVRMAVEKEVERNRALFESLHRAFASGSKSGSDSDPVK